MKRVLKYLFEINLGESFKILLPDGFKIILVEMQDNAPCIWAEVNQENVTVEAIFQIFGTGHPIPDQFEIVRSFQQPPYVWHLYQLPNPKPPLKFEIRQLRVGLTQG
jgi:hypothetical protein